MEILALITILIAGVAQSERDEMRADIQDTEAQVEIVAEYINKEITDISRDISFLQGTLLELSGSHASQGAADVVRYEKLNQQINNLHDRLDSLKGKTDYLDNKIGVLHP